MSSFVRIGWYTPSIVPGDYVQRNPSCALHAAISVSVVARLGSHIVRQAGQTLFLEETLRRGTNVFLLLGTQADGICGDSRGFDPRGCEPF